MVCVSGQYVYVSNWDGHNISVFTTQGQYVTSLILVRGVREKGSCLVPGECVWIEMVLCMCVIFIIIESKCFSCTCYIVFYLKV